MFRANIYMGFEPRLSFEDADPCKLQHRILDWQLARFPDNTYDHEICSCGRKIVETFYDQYRRLWTIITGETK